MAINIYQDKIFALQTKNNSYLLKKDENGLLSHVYWGKRIDCIADFDETTQRSENSYHLHVDQTMEEYAPFGGMRYKETALKLEFCDGTKDFRYRLTRYEADENRLELILEDVFYPCRVRLIYQVYEAEDIIRRHTVVENFGTEDIVLEKCASAQFGLAGCDYRSIQFNGTWAKEFFRQEDSVRGGKKVYESMRGSTAHVANPCFILHREADEEKGEVYFGLLAYSGNFKVTVEATPYDWTNVVIGINDTDFSWVLKPGESLETPAVYAGYSAEGFTGMSQRLHRIQHRYLMPKKLADQPLKVLYNSWYATYFDVRCEEQKKLAEKAASIGVELFVVDDGWFLGRKDDTRALGDWTPDPDKFPNGLNELIDHVKSLGMEFGLWIEPEMVNENSRLYREHPDWIYRFPNRSVLKGRNQYVLDLTKEEVVSWMIGMLDKLLSDHDIRYLKWDMNRAIGENGVYGKHSAEHKMMWHTHMLNFYRVVKTLRERHPDVEIEACASGGGRADLGAMTYFDEYWTSDNTDPLDRLSIQESYSLLYPAKYMRAWVTDSPEERKVSLRFALHAAMCGSLGIGCNLNALRREELELLKEQITVYKKIRMTVQFGELYRLKSFETDGIQAVEYLRGAEGVVFAFLPAGRYGKNPYCVKLRGLRADGTYRVNCQGRVLEKSGAYLMEVGIKIQLHGDYDSCMIQINNMV